ncbi:phospholipase A2 homolog mojave toxin acidic chain-like [Carcharodon carcharias]|uniref:phospholipase A2 homolog mojave toxin acidic chain-like n=1 Tax=Carcharodon carcharias TaxID=13397 RepID=UPI001B7DD600|nr:phospholipase A2 homolog mojave toxin acidic chain-like [Carcharodon carcharias]
MGRARRSLLLRLFLLLQLMPLPHCRDLPADDGSPRRHRVSRRSVLDIAFVLWCYRSRYQFSIYSVNGYGCYCGKGGDECPWMTSTAAASITTVATRAECPEGLDPCSSDLCLCDKQFGECLTIATFRDQYSNYQQKFCTEPKRKCPQEEKIDMEGETRR